VKFGGVMRASPHFGAKAVGGKCGWRKQERG
jgi:hypothetical protein